MKRKEIIAALKLLDRRLAKKGIKGEIGIVGGAAMALAFNARAATKDVDAIFAPTTEIRKAAQEVALELGLPEDWLNDAVKGFLPGQPIEKHEVLKLPHLFVWVPPAEYLLAMKAISARLDSQDAQDLKTLIRHLKLKTANEVLDLVSRYYPRRSIPAKTAFFVEEIFEE